MRIRAFASGPIASSDATSFASSRAPGRERPLWASGMDIVFILARVGRLLRTVRANLSRPRSGPDSLGIPAQMGLGAPTGWGSRAPIFFFKQKTAYEIS